MALLGRVLFAWGRGPRRVRRRWKGRGPCAFSANALSGGLAEQSAERGLALPGRWERGQGISRREDRGLGFLGNLARSGNPGTGIKWEGRLGVLSKEILVYVCVWGGDGVGEGTPWFSLVPIPSSFKVVCKQKDRRTLYTPAFRGVGEGRGGEWGPEGALALSVVFFLMKEFFQVLIVQLNINTNIFT